MVSLLSRYVYTSRTRVQNIWTAYLFLSFVSLYSESSLYSEGDEEFELAFLFKNWCNVGCFDFMFISEIWIITNEICLASK